MIVISAVFECCLSESYGVSHISAMWLYKSQYALSANLMLSMGMKAAEAQGKLDISKNPRTYDCSPTTYSFRYGIYYPELIDGRKHSFDKTKPPRL